MKKFGNKDRTHAIKTSALTIEVAPSSGIHFIMGKKKLSDKRQKLINVVANTVLMRDLESNR